MTTYEKLGFKREPSPYASLGYQLDPLESGYRRGYYHGGVPIEDVPVYDLPYPPPDAFRAYKPTGPLGVAIERAIRARLSDHDELVDWDLIEQETEVGYSEYTMESDYSYELRKIVKCYGSTTYRTEEFKSIAEIINWIEATK